MPRVAPEHGDITLSSAVDGEGEIAHQKHFVLDFLFLPRGYTLPAQDLHRDPYVFYLARDIRNDTVMILHNTVEETS